MKIGSEHIIVMRLKQGDEKAYRYLYEHHYVLLCKYANYWVKDPFLAETLVEDVIFRIWEMRETFEIQVSLRNYLLRAVRNRCLNYLNQSSERHEINFSQLNTEGDMNDLSGLASDEYPLGRLLEKELEEEIINAVESLPEECKRIFKKSRYEDKKNEEIATELNISVNTVKYHLKKALALLRERLGNYLTGLFLALLSFV